MQGNTRLIPCIFLAFGLVWLGLAWFSLAAFGQKNLLILLNRLLRRSCRARQEPMPHPDDGGSRSAGQTPRSPEAGLAAPLLLLFRRQVEARVRLDPAHVVVDLLHARRVLGDDLEAGAQTLVGDRAVEGDD